MLFRLGMVVFISLLSACAPKPSQLAVFDVRDRNDHVLHRIDTPAVVASIETQLNNRIRALVKKQPDFKFRLHYRHGGLEQRWRYDGVAYVAEEGKEHEAIYRIDNSQQLNLLLQLPAPNLLLSR
jgi:hypothetical protein